MLPAPREPEGLRGQEGFRTDPLQRYSLISQPLEVKGQGFLFHYFLGRVPNLLQT